MTTISLTFQGDNWGYVRAQMVEALGLDHSAQVSTASDAFPEDETGEEPILADPVPEPEPASAPKKKARTAPKLVEPEPVPEPEPEPAPAPAPVSTLARDLPSTEALKAIVTQAVRLAQKKEGPTKILELLPEFKIKTGLGFVMEAEDKHRAALADLIEAAGLAAA